MQATQLDTAILDDELSNEALNRLPSLRKELESGGIFLTGAQAQVLFVLANRAIKKDDHWCSIGQRMIYNESWLRSRTTVRSALLELERLGLIEISRGRTEQSRWRYHLTFVESGLAHRPEFKRSTGLASRPPAGLAGRPRNHNQYTEKESEANDPQRSLHCSSDRTT